MQMPGDLLRERRVGIPREHGNRQRPEFIVLRHRPCSNWLGWKDYSALRASPLRGRPPGVILPLLTHSLGPFSAHESLQPQNLAGVEGFEPPYGGIKTRCLTAWRHPNLEINSQRLSPAALPRPASAVPLKQPITFRAGASRSIH